MPDNNYDSGESEDAEDKPDSEPDPKGDKDSNEALLPKSFFRNKDNLEVGGIEKVEITHIYDDEVSVVCKYGDKKDDSKEESKDSGPMRDSMDQMDEAYSKS